MIPKSTKLGRIDAEKNPLTLYNAVKDITIGAHTGIEIIDRDKAIKAYYNIYKKDNESLLAFRNRLKYSADAKERELLSNLRQTDIPIEIKAVNGENIN
jgi:hypothetical protein